MPKVDVMNLKVNGRFSGKKMTGVQRYAIEITSRLKCNYEVIHPTKNYHGIKGHMWEQITLPILTKRDWLWSPCNTGPICKTRQIVTIHDVAPLEHPEWFNPYFSSLYNFLLPKLVRRVSKIITPSEYSRTRLLEHFPIPENRIVVIHNGVNSKFHPATKTQLHSSRHRLNLPDNYVLALGSLEPRKNLGRLFDAWETIQNKYPSLFLVVAGCPGNIFNSTGFKSVPKQVKLIGYIEDDLLPSIFTGAMFFVFPSLYEGFGLPPLEAMACGCPVLTSQSTSIPEVCGDAAIYLDPYDTDDITEKIDQLAFNETILENLREKGLHRSKQFSWETSTRKTLDVINTTINN